MPYCTKEDLLTGDIPLGGKYGDGSSFVQMAADEIDGEIGHIYTTPVAFDVSTPELAALARPSELQLKKINRLLASGRIILDMAAAGEDDALHAYGQSMWREATTLLTQIASGQRKLIGAEELASVADDRDSGPSIVQADAESLVEGFYARHGSGPILAQPGLHMRPTIYDGGQSQ